MIQLDEIKKLTDQIQLDRLEKIANQVKTVVLKNRVLSIGSAIALVTFYKLYTAVIRPPTQLRHIPAWGYWDFLKMMFSRDVTAKSLDITMKLLEKENYPPVYLVNIYIYKK
jgi:hypothetical protein